MNISIRPATVEDARDIANVVSASTTLLDRDYNEEQIKILVDHFNADLYLEAIQADSETILVAETEKIVGFGSIASNGRAIGDLFMLPEYTRQGIGTLLLETLEQIALQKQVPRLWVMSSLTARPFYAACGFQYEKDSALIDAATETKIPCVDMTKILARQIDFKGDNPAYYGNLSTLTVPQFIRLTAKLLLGRT